MYLYFLDRIISRRERKGGVIRALILTLSILAIIDSAHFAKAGMSSTPRETSAPADTAIARAPGARAGRPHPPTKPPPPADTAIATSEATQQTEEQIGLTKAKRRN